MRPIATWPAAWYGVGYPYDAGLYPPASSAPTDYPYLEPSQVNGSANQSTYSSPPSGWLELPLAQGSADVYIDGYYAGQVSDFNGPGGRAVEPGPHHIEIRAPGYQTSSFDVRLQPDQPVAYREDLRPVSGTEPPGAAARTSVASGTTFYVIAGCYMGNVPPAQAGPLPPGCDRDQVQTMEIRRH
jgi:hypothetical protein